MRGDSSFNIYDKDGNQLNGAGGGGGSAFEQDADANLFAGTGAGGSYDPSSSASCYNIFLGCNVGSNLSTGAENNVFLDGVPVVADNLLEIIILL